MTTVTFTSSGTWNAPAGVVQIDCQCWGEGGNGANALVNSHSGGGGGGGEFAEETTLVVTAGNNYSYTIGSGGSGTNTSFPGDSVTVTAAHGANGLNATGGAAGGSSTNTIHHAGGGGGNGVSSTSKGGGGGGSSAGTGSVGSSGGNAGSSSGAAGGTAPSGGGNGGNGGSSTNSGQAGSVPGGGGGGGGDSGSSHPGGSGATGQITLTYFVNVAGTATLTGEGTLSAASLVATPAQPYPSQIAPGQAWLRRFGYGRHQTLPGLQVQTITPAAVSLSGVGAMVANGGLPAPVVVNQWANNYGQGTAFGSITSSLQSCVVPLNAGFSVGGGSGTPTSGNWLFCIASWTQDPQIVNVHTGTSDDTHQWWRQFPASGANGNVRTSVSYVPNIGTGSTNSIVPQYVYCAPDGSVAAINVLVVEIAGLGPWDTVTGKTSNYTSSGTSVSLSLGAPSRTSLVMGAVGGDNIGSGQAFLPGGWTGLAAQTQSNGVDTTADNILTAAFLPSTSGSVSVSGTSSSAEDLSGYLLQVAVGATSPIPASQNPNWPYTKFEAAFGAGFNTPNSELTWTDLTNRLWSWDEITGIQFQLGQLQSTNLNIELDNFDGALTLSASPWSFSTTGTPTANSYFTVTTAQSASISVGDGFTDTVNAGTFFTVTSLGPPSGGNVNVSFTPAATSVMTGDTVSQASLVSGTPIRLRMALGTFGGQNISRWCMIQRNVNEWGGEISSAFRRYCPVSGTDMWSSMSSVPPTFYRSEIYEDGPGWWWPMDDQPGEGGVLPTSLLNAATSGTVMNIVASPAGITSQDAYSTIGRDMTIQAPQGGAGPPPSIAVYQVGANSGWMYGDPPSSASSFATATGNPVEPSAGSASWQQSGVQGTGGSNGWFLSANDAFPGLSGGVTVKGWFNAGFFGSAAGWVVPNLGSGSNVYVIAGQPYSAITVCELATASAPVAVLQLDLSGHLNLITYNGGTGTSHSIYSASDLRYSSWIAVDMLLTTTTWQVLVNGGLTANVSGSATGMTSAWTYLILNGDMNAGGGANTSNIQHGANVAYSHWTVFPYKLPAWRLLSHYTAAISGFGLLPAPFPSAQVQLSEPAPLPSVNPSSEGYSLTPDGAANDGSYAASGGSLSSFTLSAVVTSNAGSYSSAPSARAAVGATGQTLNEAASGPPSYGNFGNAVWVSWTNVAAPVFTIYTNSAVGSETSAAQVLGSGDAFTSGYGAAAHSASGDAIAAGSGASPPAAATPLGDTVAQRIERLMRAGRTTSPQRSIDPSPGLVQAPGISGGGQQTNTSVQAIQQSDQGMLFVDNVGYLNYWMRSHLASQYSSPVWTVGPSTGQVPYYREYRLVNDPQRIFNVITVQPFSPSGAQLPELTPSNASGVTSSQTQYGAQPLAVTSYLQDQTVMQSQANWLFTNFGSPQTRAENVRVDAAPYPPAWPMVATVNVGDIITLEEWQVGGGGDHLTLRVTEINRKIRFGGMNDGNAGEGEVVASIELTLDFEPLSYF